jgi:hypothetical protein
VLKQISPVVVPILPAALPRKKVPSSRRRIAFVIDMIWGAKVGKEKGFQGRK